MQRLLARERCFGIAQPGCYGSGLGPVSWLWGSRSSQLLSQTHQRGFLRASQSRGACCFLSRGCFVSGSGEGSACDPARTRGLSPSRCEAMGNFSTRSMGCRSKEATPAARGRCVVPGDELVGQQSPYQGRHGLGLACRRQTVRRRARPALSSPSHRRAARVNGHSERSEPGARLVRFPYLWCGGLVDSLVCLRTHCNGAHPSHPIGPKVTRSEPRTKPVVWP